jgi:hypothetical protein
MVDIEKMRRQLLEAGRLQDKRDIQLFDAMAEYAPEILALIFAASLAGVFVTETDPSADPARNDSPRSAGQNRDLSDPH